MPRLPPGKRFMPDNSYRFSDVFIHESSYVDDGVEIGAGTKIWHFCHILANTRIGTNCSMGQNVVVGPNVVVGNNVMTLLPTTTLGPTTTFCPIEQFVPIRVFASM